MTGKNATEVIAADAAGIARAATILAGGGLVAVPTETVYGLAARADSPEAVARIYAAKGRPDFNPLIVHVRDVEQAQRYAQLSGVALDVAGGEWPGPLTLVLPLRAIRLRSCGPPIQIKFHNMTIEQKLKCLKLISRQVGFDER